MQFSYINFTRLHIFSKNCTQKMNWERKNIFRERNDFGYESRNFRWNTIFHTELFPFGAAKRQPKAHSYPRSRVMIYPVQWSGFCSCVLSRCGAHVWARHVHSSIYIVCYHAHTARTTHTTCRFSTAHKICPNTCAIRSAPHHLCKTDPPRHKATYFTRAMQKI